MQDNNTVQISPETMAAMGSAEASFYKEKALIAMQRLADSAAREESLRGYSNSLRAELESIEDKKNAEPVEPEFVIDHKSEALAKMLSDFVNEGTRAESAIDSLIRDAKRVMEGE